MANVPAALIDSNLYVSAFLTPSGTAARLIVAWYSHRFNLITSRQQIDEFLTAITRPKLAFRLAGFRAEIQAFVAAMLEDAAVVAAANVTLPPVDLRDANDAHILAAALAGDADYLVTGDQDLLVLAGDPRLGKLRIVTAAQFLEVLVA